MTTQHTPGPWRTEETNHGLANQITVIGADETRISHRSPIGPITPLDRANFRLIAAAPQLLTAAISALDCLDEILEDTDDAEGHEGTMVPNPLLVQLRAAIAQAQE